MKLDKIVIIRWILYNKYYNILLYPFDKFTIVVHNLLIFTTIEIKHPNKLISEINERSL